MSNRETFLSQQTDDLFTLEGFEQDQAVFLKTIEGASEYVDDLDDILFGMDSVGFEDEEWVNEDAALIAVFGAGEDGYVVQAQGFLLHLESTGKVYVLEMAPVSAETFEDLPVYANSLEELAEKIS